MKRIARTILLFLAVVTAGCNRDSGGSTEVSSSAVWPTNEYRHLEHITNLVRQANVIVATNQTFLNQWSEHGDFPLRGFLGIPATEPTGKIWAQGWAQGIEYNKIIFYSSKTGKLLGEIRIKPRSNQIESVHDFESLFMFDEMESKLRRIVGTREKALRLFRGGLPESPSTEQERVAEDIANALFLPSDVKTEISMAAPGGSNRGQGYLTIETVQKRYMEPVAQVFYGTGGDGIIRGILVQFGLWHHHYEFDHLTLWPAWTNANTQGLLLDPDGFPYPQAPSANIPVHTNSVN